MININTNLESTTLWSFPERGEWLGHKGDYRGNWSPHVPKNIILMYSNKNDIVLDQFIGSGTTIIEACRLGRKCIGIDINYNALKISESRAINIDKNKFILRQGDATNLSFINNESIDLICTHPPYANIIKYSSNLDRDISLLEECEFYKEMRKAAKECYRVLKKGKYCAFLIGDTRKNGFIVPLGFNVMNIFQESGFKLKEIIIKQQHNCKSTDKWIEISKLRKFYLIAHEYLFVFKKED